MPFFLVLPPPRSLLSLLSQPLVGVFLPVVVKADEDEDGKYDTTHQEKGEEGGKDSLVEDGRYFRGYCLIYIYSSVLKNLRNGSCLVFS